MVLDLLSYDREKQIVQKGLNFDEYNPEIKEQLYGHDKKGHETFLHAALEFFKEQG